VNFAGATLESASFSGGTITNSRFDNTNLNTSQFKRANIADSSFENAKLYRAIFDKTCLKGVDFKRADLRWASFSGAHFASEDRFADNFRDTGWWLAYGWNSREIKALLSADQSGVAQSEAFKYYLGLDIDKLRHSRTGTREQANALNGVAWTMATWGVGDLGEVPGGLKAACGPDSRRLTSALDFAEEGICIARRLNPNSGRQTADLANFRDTKAYLLIQQGNLVEAYEEYRGLIGSDRRGDRLFRAAIVAAALSRTDQARSAMLKTEADANLEKSLAVGYFPSHELQTLKNDIPEDLWKKIYENNDKLWPPVQNCERPNSDAVNWHMDVQGLGPASTLSGNAETATQPTRAVTSKTATASPSFRVILIGSFLKWNSRTKIPHAPKTRKGEGPSDTVMLLRRDCIPSHLRDRRCQRCVPRLLGRVLAGKA
jgi:hypothetical protein